MNKGLIHFYLGNGKGKSTASFGLALRALGRNFKVLILQFLKTEDSGEVIYLNKLSDENLRIKQCPFSGKFTWEMTQDELYAFKSDLHKFLENNKEDFYNYDLIIFDELFDILDLDFISENDISNIILSKKPNQEYIFTGRKSSEYLLSFADYVSTIEATKHPFSLGIDARKGIEF